MTAELLRARKKASVMFVAGIISLLGLCALFVCRVRETNAFEFREVFVRLRNRVERRRQTFKELARLPRFYSDPRESGFFFNVIGNEQTPLTLRAFFDSTHGTFRQKTLFLAFFYLRWLSMWNAALEILSLLCREQAPLGDVAKIYVLDFKNFVEGWIREIELDRGLHRCADPAESLGPWYKKLKLLAADEENFSQKDLAVSWPYANYFRFVTAFNRAEFASAAQYLSVFN